MIRRLIIFLVRVKLGVKKYEVFRFSNQKSKEDYYCFTDAELLKTEKGIIRPSSVSLNWLLNDKCQITILQG